MSDSNDDTQLPQTNVTLPEHKSKYWNTESHAGVKVPQAAGVSNVINHKRTSVLGCERSDIIAIKGVCLRFIY